MNLRKALAFALLAPLFFTAGAGAMNFNRFSFSSVLLPDGNILITGGTESGTMASARVEMYNMATNNFDNWGALVTGRSSHTATVMSDGRVLIAGGVVANGDTTNSLEICNPVAKTCAGAGVSLVTARAWHTATLLSKGPNAGKVLICGGKTGTAASTHTATESCEFFNPVGPAVTAAPSLVENRMGHTAVLLGSGRVFVSGGVRAGGGGSAQWIYEPNNNMYDPYTNQWTPVSALLKGRIGHSATVLNNGKIMIAGGYNEVNKQVCIGTPGALEYDCWHLLYDPLNTQNNGTQGYIDGAEFYDQNGGRVVVSEEKDGMLPYRVARHSAALTPDGKWRVHAGYGNIFPTFFTNAPTLTSNTTFFLTQVTDGTTHFATINNTSIVEFPLDYNLSRPVSGRFVDADAFISGPPTAGSASVEFDAVKFYMAAQRAALDGKAAGLLLCPDPTDPVGCIYSPGDFNSLVRLSAPSGRVTFDKVITGSGDDINPTTVVSGTLTMAPNPLLPTEAGRNLTGTMRANVRLTVPDVFSHIHGVAKVLSGQINDTGGNYSITFDESGRANFSFTDPASCDHLTDKTCTFTAALDFTNLRGQISNLTTLEAGTTYYNALTTGTAALVIDNNIPGDNITLSLELDFVADEVYALDRTPTYSFDRSTTVVREMIFNSQLGYSPAANKWDDLTDVTASPALYMPAFDNTAVLTPAGDTWVMGGRNCEINPANCLRATKTFLPVSSGTVSVPSYRDSQGATKWAASPPLATKRAFHTSTVLPTGHILTCGGSDGARPLATCELMDPATKAWGPTGSMNMARANHTATLLPNGTVLAAGGVNPSGVAISSAEIFYPDTQRWVPTSPMAYARQLHTATLLPDGNVLVAGGATLSTYAATAELYISSTAYWQATVNNMVNGRSQHTATLLKNGTVMLAGGINGFGPMKQTEFFDSQTRQFNGGQSLNTARYAHTATLLRDGSVLVAGGSDGIDATGSCEIYNGTNWQYTLVGYMYPRANHRTVLLPNGKVMSTGGEFRSVAQAVPEGFDPDFRYWNLQGTINSRSHHTTVVTPDNRIMNIGGWSGGAYLSQVDYADFNYSPDMNGLDAETTRQAWISTGTVFFNQTSSVTLMSGTSNFHGLTEASGGGAGPMNSAFANPRVYMQQIDNQSGFMIDLSTRIYSFYGGLNTAWDRTVSSITIIMPALPGELPHGWYHMRTAAAAMFSDAHTVQVTVPRPLGVPSDPTGTVLGTSSITWTWSRNTVPANGADGYTIYSATDNVFITTVAFANTATYTQTGMVPNTAASIKVAPFNLGGHGSLAKSVTYYTLAAVPEPLNITAASFETALLEWARNNNSELTTYEVSMSPSKPIKFSDPVSISTPVPFSVNYMSTSTTVDQLSPNQPYDFRVRARNGAGLVTAFTTPASTITISGVNNFSGQALSSATIAWSWDASVGATYYEVYDVTTGTATAVMISSTTTNSLTQTGLLANRQYYAVVSAVNDTSGFGPIRGPLSNPVGVYTLTVAPLPATPNYFSNVSTGSLTANWITNGNSSWTVYNVSITSGTGVSTVTTTENRISFAGLPPNVKHTVTVTPYNGDGIAGQTLDLGGKYTLAKVPAYLAATDISMSGIQLEWDPDGNSAETVYEVRSSTSELFANPITTHKEFNKDYTDTSLFVNGLLTGTSYYFDVAACNGEGRLSGCTGVGVTARKRAVAAFTLAGPSGAPAGSVGGTSDPSATSVISGTLLNGMKVSLTVPAGSFPATTAIAISSSVTNSCGSYAISGRTVEVAVYTQNGAQPQEPVTLELTYSGSLTGSDIPKLVLARYNPVSGQCLPLETKISEGYKKITATLNHFSVFQLMLRAAASDLNSVLAYPNPFYTNRGQGFVTIDRVPANSKVRIYTLSGDKVWEAQATTTGMLIWKGVNSSGNLVASGIYLAVIDSSAGKKVLKLAVER